MLSTRAWWTSLPISLRADELQVGVVAAGYVGGAVACVEDLMDGGSTARASCSRLAEWRRTMAAVRMAPRGLALPVPAMSGAEPWTGS